MLLVCPNCGAQYKVDSRVIPESGRDVQCSACGHAWYQLSQEHLEAHALKDAAEEENLIADATEAGLEDSETEDATPADEGAIIEETPVVEFEPEPEPEPAAEPEAEEPEPRTLKRREIDDGVRSILQEEAQREMEARKAEVSQDAAPVETQPDLGLETGPSEEEQRIRAARERMARMRGVDDEDPLIEGSESVADAEPKADAPAPPDVESVPRRELLPDIEEINSTLDGHEFDGDRRKEHASSIKGGNAFGRGFFLMILLAAVAFIVYMRAPQFAETLPAVEPVLSGYVDFVNRMRETLDGALQGLLEAVQSRASERPQ